MRPYYHLCRQEQPDLSHQTPQKVLILVLGEWYTNCYMIPELAIKYNLWQVGSVLVSLRLYQESKVGQELMYMQHRYMVCGKSHILHDLVFDQNVNDDDYSTPLIHETLDVDQKMVILVIGLYNNIFLHICVQHQHYPEHDIICLYILF